jgi:tRNA1(Val) A37 N6-methylase TrmN6
MIHATKNSKSATTVLAPLVTFENEHYTQEVQEIYNKAKAHSIKCPII